MDDLKENSDVQYVDETGFFKDQGLPESLSTYLSFTVPSLYHSWQTGHSQHGIW